MMSLINIPLVKREGLLQQQQLWHGLQPYIAHCSQPIKSITDDVIYYNTPIHNKGQRFSTETANNNLYLNYVVKDGSKEVYFNNWK